MEECKYVVDLWCVGVMLCVKVSISQACIGGSSQSTGRWGDKVPGTAEGSKGWRFPRSPRSHLTVDYLRQEIAPPTLPRKTRLR